jgi:hypothetical protein
VSSIITEEEREELQRLAVSLAGQELPSGWELVQSSAFARVARNRERGIYYKEFLPRSPLETLKAALRGSRATRARRQGEALLLAGFEAPANLAWGSLPGGREYLFTREARGRDVTSWLQARPGNGTGVSLATRRQLLRQLGVFVGRLHATGFVHGDLRPGNVLADLCQGRFLFTLIDNERTVQRHPPPGRMLLRNLMQLNMLPSAVLSRADRMRFFTGWRRQMRELSPVEAKLLASESYLWAMRRMAAKAQHGR